MARRRNQGKVYFKISGPGYLMDKVYYAEASTHTMWSDMISTMIYSHIDLNQVFVCTQNYAVKRKLATYVRAWKADLNTTVGDFIRKYDRKLSTYSVRIFMRDRSSSYRSLQQEIHPDTIRQKNPFRSCRNFSVAASYNDDDESAYSESASSSLLANTTQHNEHMNDYDDNNSDRSPSPQPPVIDQCVSAANFDEEQPIFRLPANPPPRHSPPMEAIYLGDDNLSTFTTASTGPQYYVDDIKDSVLRRLENYPNVHLVEVRKELRLLKKDTDKFFRSLKRAPLMFQLLQNIFDEK